VPRSCDCCALACVSRRLRRGGFQQYAFRSRRPAAGLSAQGASLFGLSLSKAHCRPSRPPATAYCRRPTPVRCGRLRVPAVGGAARRRVPRKLAAQGAVRLCRRQSDPAIHVASALRDRSKTASESRPLRLRTPRSMQKPHVAGSHHESHHLPRTHGASSHSAALCACAAFQSSRRHQSMAIVAGVVSAQTSAGPGCGVRMNY